MKFNRIVAVVGVIALVIGFALAQPVQAERPDKPKKDGVHGRFAEGNSSESPDGSTEGTAWLIYDDGTREAWGSAYSGSYDALGNKFTSTWGTFFCDSVSAFAQWNSSSPSFYLSAWNALSGTTLQSNSYTTVSMSSSPTSGWVGVASAGWINNPTYTFSNTAWIGNDFYSGAGVGVDTDGGSHGFAVASYTGTGYAEQPFNAMIRARFNGDNVPVELMSFTAE